MGQPIVVHNGIILIVICLKSDCKYNQFNPNGNRSGPLFLPPRHFRRGLADAGGGAPAAPAQPAVRAGWPAGARQTGPTASRNGPFGNAKRAVWRCHTARFVTRCGPGSLTAPPARPATSGPMAGRAGPSRPIRRLSSPPRGARRAARSSPSRCPASPRGRGG